MITVNYQNVMAQSIGSKNGIEFGELKGEINKNVHILKNFSNEIVWKQYFAELPYCKDVADRIIAFADDKLNTFKNFIHIGIGGSALGAIAIHSALAANHFSNKDLPKTRNY